MPVERVEHGRRRREERVVVRSFVAQAREHGFEARCLGNGRAADVEIVHEPRETVETGFAELEAGRFVRTTSQPFRGDPGYFCAVVTTTFRRAGGPQRSHPRHPRVTIG